MQERIVSKIGNNVINLLSLTAKKIGKKVDFIKRRDKAKIAPDVFSKVLILGYLSDIKISLHGLSQLFKQEGVKVSKQAVHERFNPAAVELMKGLFKESFDQLKNAQSVVIELLQPFSSIKILDSSTIALPSHMKELYKGCGGVGPEATLKIQTLLDYGNGQIEDITITDGRKNDQSFKRHLEKIEEGALYLQDLGYFDSESLSKLHKNKAYFISRLFTQTALYDINGERLDLAKKLQKSGRFFTIDVFLSKQHKVPVRLIIQRLSEAAMATSIRKIRENAQRHGKTPTKATLNFSGWSICVTNIPKEMLKEEQVYLLYAVRWQIELFFKLCKKEAGVAKIRSKKTDRILCEIYARLIGVMLLLYMSWPVRWEVGGEHELSFPKAYQCLRKRTAGFFKALSSLYRLKLFLKDFLSDLQAFAMKDIKRKNPATHQKLMASTGQKVLGVKLAPYQKLMWDVSQT